jgi:hypothetical protein
MNIEHSDIGLCVDITLTDILRIPSLSYLNLRPWEPRGNKICSQPTG